MQRTARLCRRSFLPLHLFNLNLSITKSALNTWHAQVKGNSIHKQQPDHDLIVIQVSAPV